MVIHVILMGRTHEEYLRQHPHHAQNHLGQHERWWRFKFGCLEYILCPSYLLTISKYSFDTVFSHLLSAIRTGTHPHRCLRNVTLIQCSQISCFLRSRVRDLQRYQTNLIRNMEHILSLGPISVSRAPTSKKLTEHNTKSI